MNINYRKILVERNYEDWYEFVLESANFKIYFHFINFTQNHHIYFHAYDDSYSRYSQERGRLHSSSYKSPLSFIPMSL